MKKQERKENANKGFSLVELIVVVAIMAVLLVVLTPQYLRYVERTRLQKDNSAIAEIANAIKIAVAEETVNDATTFPVSIAFDRDANNNMTVEFPADVLNTTNVQTALGNELAATVGSTYTTSSNTYKDAAKPLITLEVRIVTNGTVEVEAKDGWIDTVGGTPGNHLFN